MICSSMRSTYDVISDNKENCCRVGSADDLMQGGMDFNSHSVMRF